MSHKGGPQVLADTGSAIINTGQGKPKKDDSSSSLLNPSPPKKTSPSPNKDLTPEINVGLLEKRVSY